MPLLGKLTLVLLLFIGLAGLTTEIRDNTFFLNCQVPDSWQQKVIPSDFTPEHGQYFIINNTALLIISKSRSEGLVKDDYDPNREAMEWAAVMSYDLSHTEGINIESSGVQTIGKYKCAYARIAGNGKGNSFLQGATPTKRSYIYIPHGIDLIQFIFTCPAASFTTNESAVMKVIESLQFSQIILPRPTSQTATTTEPTEGQSPEPLPQPTPSPVMETPYFKYNSLSDLAVSRAQILLSQAGIPVYEPVIANAPCDLVLISLQDGKPYRAQVVMPVVEKTDATALQWQISSARLALTDAVVVLKARNQLGWIVSAAFFMNAAEAKDGELTLSAGKQMKDGTVLDLLKAYADPKKVLP